MTSRPIGGYFEWEFPSQTYAFPHEEGVLVNNNRSALQIIIRSLGNVGKVHIPYYICDSVTQALDAIGVPFSQYHIDEQLHISGNIVPGENEYIIYTNYFGVQDAYCRQLAERYGDRLIVDNAQALYAPHISGTHSAYSVRKYIGAPDGGIAVSAALGGLDESTLPDNPVYDRCGALLARADGDIATGYGLFHDNDARFRSDGARRMSLVTRRILASVDHEEIIRRRRNNYQTLHAALCGSNRLRLPALHTFACPMVYPYMTDDPSLRDRLIDQQIFVARYWPNVLDWCGEATTEHRLTRHVMPLPIDQRYGYEDMQRIINVIENH